MNCVCHWIYRLEDFSCSCIWFRVLPILLCTLRSINFSFISFSVILPLSKCLFYISIGTVHYLFFIHAVMPDFAQVYNFIGRVFDPNTSGHLQKLKELDPIDVETVSLLSNLNESFSLYHHPLWTLIPHIRGWHIFLYICTVKSFQWRLTLKENKKLSLYLMNEHYVLSNEKLLHKQLNFIIFLMKKLLCLCIWSSFKWKGKTSRCNEDIIYTIQKSYHHHQGQLGQGFDDDGIIQSWVFFF